MTNDSKRVTREDLAVAINRYDAIMGDSKRVTREGLALAVVSVDVEDERVGVVGRGRWIDRVFDALPDPPPSEAVDAAYRDSLVNAMPWYDEANPDYSELDALIAAREAAIRAEGLDVERLARALRTETVRRYVKEAWVDGGVSEPGYATTNEMAIAIAAEYARLTQNKR